MAEPYEIAFAIESQHRAVAGAVHERQERERLERRERRERRNRRAFRQDKGNDALKQARQTGAGTAGAKATAMETRAIAEQSMAASRIQAVTLDGPERRRKSAGRREPSRFATAASHAFWTWLVPAIGVLAGAAVLFMVLLLHCFLP